jgi:hypothetical protein
MTNKKRDPLKSLIRKVKLDKPSLSFTDLVMEEVKAQKEAVINPALKSLLKRNGIENPSIEFTRSVITQVEALDFQRTYKSIITKKVWLIIISGIGLLVLYAGLSGETLKSPEGLTRYFIDIGNALSTLLSRVNFIPPLYAITFISLGGLLVTDYLLRIRSQSQETK